MFRGYLLQQLGARFTGLMDGLSPSILFGFLHYSPGLPTVTPWSYIVDQAPAVAMPTQPPRCFTGGKTGIH